MHSRDPIAVQLVAGTPQRVRLPDCERWQWGTNVPAGQTVTMGLTGPGLSVPSAQVLTGDPGAGGALSMVNVGLGRQAFVEFTGPTGSTAFVFCSGGDIAPNRG